MMERHWLIVALNHRPLQYDSYIIDIITVRTQKEMLKGALLLLLHVFGRTLVLKQ